MDSQALEQLLTSAAFAVEDQNTAKKQLGVLDAGAEPDAMISGLDKGARGRRAGGGGCSCRTRVS